MATKSGNVLTDTMSVYLNNIGLPYNGITPGNIKKSAQVQKEAAETISSAFDIVAWIKENWQLTVIGFVALLVLLRD